MRVEIYLVQLSPHFSPLKLMNLTLGTLSNAEGKFQQAKEMDQVAEELKKQAETKRPEGVEQYQQR